MLTKSSGARVPAAAVRGLRARLRGPLLEPGDPGYDDERAAFEQSVEQFPALIVGAEDRADVVTAVRFAARHGMRLAVQSTGHGIGRPADDDLLVSTRRMTGVQVDPGAATARVSAGTRWSEVIDAAAPSGLAPLSGSAPFVGAVGYLLGGGIGVLARRYGYAADHVRRFEVVGADGRVRTVSADSHPDLFWALRGGQGNFGVVTEMEIDLFPVAELYGGGLYFPGELTRDLLHAYSRFTRTLPDRTSTSLAIFPFPDEPGVPEPIRGRSVVHIRVAHLGDPAEGERLLAPLRAVGDTLMDTVRTMPYTEVGSIHDDFPEPAPTANDSTHLRELDERGVEVLLGHAAPDVDPLFAVELRHLGGALARPPRTPSAVARTTCAYQLYLVSMWSPEQDAEIRRAHRRTLSAMAPWDGGRKTLNFFSGRSNDSPDAVRSAFDEADHRRLQELKARYDPDNRFGHGHNILPAHGPGSRADDGTAADRRQR